MQILLIAGLWLDGSAWDSVVPELQARGHHATALTLPGQGAPPAQASLDDQRAAVLRAVDAADGQVLLVGHSAACTLAWMAADARPEKTAAVVLIGGFPSADGDLYADFFEPVDGLMYFPGWQPFEGADADDLDERARERFTTVAVPVSARVTRGVVSLTDPRRFEIPLTLICPEFSPEQAQEWLERGDSPELAKVTNLTLVDIASGHWPMITQPVSLAAILDSVVAQIR